MELSPPSIPDDASRDQALRSIVYSSRSATGFQDVDLADLLAQSRTNNERLGLTGMLLYRDGRFLQLLEGPTGVLEERMSVIATDPRHHDVRTLLSEQLTGRLLPSWTMGYPTVGRAEIDDIPGYRRTFEDLDTDTDSSFTLPALRELIRWFRDRTH
ncbi:MULTISPECIES: BLUF domain-containing protein [unclassified Rathayibacter]|uniref:BLUF domain-containing protein n=1 Tax=unclassified Rathayibacter TaxID=2609250 RepID=UPI001FB3985D|nr:MULTISPECIES: BLUF domain-containing protein [unclassified Rathayibacter]